MRLETTKKELQTTLEFHRAEVKRFERQIELIARAIDMRDNLAPLVDAERKAIDLEKRELTQERIDLNSAFVPGKELPILDVLDLIQKRDDRLKSLRKIRK